jgi:hypothetical protein
VSAASRTLAELARSSRCPRALLERVLDDEVTARRVVREPAGAYQLVPGAFEPDVLDALRALDEPEVPARR